MLPSRKRVRSLSSGSPRADKPNHARSPFGSNGSLSSIASVASTTKLHSARRPGSYQSATFSFARHMNCTSRSPIIPNRSRRRGCQVCSSQESFAEFVNSSPDLRTRSKVKAAAMTKQEIIDSVIKRLYPGSGPGFPKKKRSAPARLTFSSSSCQPRRGDSRETQVRDPSCYHVGRRVRESPKIVDIGDPLTSPPWDQYLMSDLEPRQLQLPRARCLCPIFDSCGSLSLPTTAIPSVRVTDNDVSMSDDSLDASFDNNSNFDRDSLEGGYVYHLVDSQERECPRGREADQKAESRHPGAENSSSHAIPAAEATASPCAPPITQTRAENDMRSRSAITQPTAATHSADQQEPGFQAAAEARPAPAAAIIEHRVTLETRAEPGASDEAHLCAGIRNSAFPAPGTTCGSPVPAAPEQSLSDLPSDDVETVPVQRQSINIVLDYSKISPTRLYTIAESTYEISDMSDPEFPAARNRLSSEERRTPAGSPLIESDDELAQRNWLAEEQVFSNPVFREPEDVWQTSQPEDCGFPANTEDPADSKDPRQLIGLISNEEDNNEVLVIRESSGDPDEDCVDVVGAVGGEDVVAMDTLPVVSKASSEKSKKEAIKDIMEIFGQVQGQIQQQISHLEEQQAKFSDVQPGFDVQKQLPYHDRNERVWSDGTVPAVGAEYSDTFCEDETKTSGLSASSSGQTREEMAEPAMTLHPDENLLHLSDFGVSNHHFAASEHQRGTPSVDEVESIPEEIEVEEQCISESASNTCSIVIEPIFSDKFGTVGRTAEGDCVSSIEEGYEFCHVVNDTEGPENSMENHSAKLECLSDRNPDRDPPNDESDCVLSESCDLEAQDHQPRVVWVDSQVPPSTEENVEEDLSKSEEIYHPDRSNMETIPFSDEPELTSYPYRTQTENLQAVRSMSYVGYPYRVQTENLPAVRSLSCDGIGVISPQCIPNAVEAEAESVIDVEDLEDSANLESQPSLPPCSVESDGIEDPSSRRSSGATQDFGTLSFPTTTVEESSNVQSTADSSASRDHCPLEEEEEETLDKEVKMVNGCDTYEVVGRPSPESMSSSTIPLSASERSGGENARWLLETRRMASSLVSEVIRLAEQRVPGEINGPHSSISSEIEPEESNDEAAKPEHLDTSPGELDVDVTDAEVSPDVEAMRDVGAFGSPTEQLHADGFHFDDDFGDRDPEDLCPSYPAIMLEEENPDGRPGNTEELAIAPDESDDLVVGRQGDVSHMVLHLEDAEDQNLEPFTVQASSPVEVEASATLASIDESSHNCDAVVEANDSLTRISFTLESTTSDRLHEEDPSAPLAPCVLHTGEASFAFASPEDPFAGAESEAMDFTDLAELAKQIMRENDFLSLETIPEMSKEEYSLKSSENQDSLQSSWNAFPGLSSAVMEQTDEQEDFAEKSLIWLGGNSRSVCAATSEVVGEPSSATVLNTSKILESTISQLELDQLREFPDASDSFHLTQPHWSFMHDPEGSLTDLSSSAECQQMPRNEQSDVQDSFCVEETDIEQEQTVIDYFEMQGTEDADYQEDSKTPREEESSRCEAEELDEEKDPRDEVNIGTDHQISNAIESFEVEQSDVEPAPAEPESEDVDVTEEPDEGCDRKPTQSTTPVWRASDESITFVFIGSTGRPEKSTSQSERVGAKITEFPMRSASVGSLDSSSLGSNSQSLSRHRTKKMSRENDSSRAYRQKQTNESLDPLSLAKKKSVSWGSLSNAGGHAGSVHRDLASATATMEQEFRWRFQPAGQGDPQHTAVPEMISRISNGQHYAATGMEHYPEKSRSSTFSESWDETSDHGSPYRLPTQKRQQSVRQRNQIRLRHLSQQFLNLQSEYRTSAIESCQAEDAIRAESTRTRPVFSKSISHDPRDDALAREDQLLTLRKKMLQRRLHEDPPDPLGRDYSKALQASQEKLRGVNSSSVHDFTTTDRAQHNASSSSYEDIFGQRLEPFSTTQSLPNSPSRRKLQHQLSSCGNCCSAVHLYHSCSSHVPVCCHHACHGCHVVCHDGLNNNPLPASAPPPLRSGGKLDSDNYLPRPSNYLRHLVSVRRQIVQNTRMLCNQGL